MRKPSKSNPAIVHPDQLPLFGTVEPSAVLSPSVPSGDTNGTSSDVLAEPGSPGPMQGHPASTPRPASGAHDGQPDGHTARQGADPVPFSLLPPDKSVDQRTVAEDVRSLADEADETAGNHMACTGGGTLTYSPSPTCHPQETQIGVTVTQLLNIYELLRPLVGDEHAPSTRQREGGGGPRAAARPLSGPTGHDKLDFGGAGAVARATAPSDRP